MSLTCTTLAVFLEGDAASAFQSPFIVPVAGALMVLGIVVASIWAGVRAQEMRSAERLAAIAKGLPLPPAAEEPGRQNAVSSAPGSYAPPSNGAGARRAGLILLFTGIGLIAFFVALTVIVQVKEVLSGAAVGLIPALIGVGFLIDARLRRTEYERALDAPPPSQTGSGSQLGPLH